MATPRDVRPVTSHEELLALTDQDPFIRYAMPPEIYSQAWASGHAVAFPRLRQSHDELGLTVTGAPDDVPALLQFAAHRLDLTRIRAVMVDHDLLPAMLAAFDRHPDLTVTDGGDWDWMWTTTCPPRIPEEDRLVELDDQADAEQIAELNRVANPTAESQPGQGRSERWVGIRDAGRLVAAAAMHRTAAGIPHLTGITVAPSHRGRHLGLAMTAALTRGAVIAERVCSLGMYSTNDVARGVYTRLGYQVAHAWSSRHLDPVHAADRSAAPCHGH